MARIRRRFLASVATSAICGLAASAMLTGVAQAQNVAESRLDKIVVTGTKKKDGVDVQDAPVAVTAYGAEQLENLRVNALGDLGYRAPNVSLDDVGTFPGYANFSIRGLGINSSVPSIDPTVGVFVDGMYLGLSGGILFDTFDIESVEILRGPQGLLFGRNVTGGAIVLNTKTPGDELEVSARAAVEDGLKYILSGSVSGPVIEDKLSLKLAAYYADDEGWFENQLTGDGLGASETTIIRPALNFTPTDNLQFIVKVEAGFQNGDGPPAQNRAIRGDNEFGINIDEPGFSDVEWTSVVSETNLDVGFGDGVITNVFAWRRFEAATLSDVDASPIVGFHAGTLTDQRQFSNELRYAGTFGSVDITTGLYYFTQDIQYIEDRLLFSGAFQLTGGGEQTYNTYGAFASADWRLSDVLTLNLGLRYTYEEKQASLADLVPGGCSLATLMCNATFNDEEDWSNLSPKVGLQWTPDDDTLVYAHWTRGFRSGGYNFRNNATTIPGPYDPEEQDSFEVGFKKDIAGTARVNFAAFYNQIDSLQREILFIENNVTFQTIANAADANVFGFELEGLVNVSDNLSLSGHVGYLEDEYTDAFFDLNRDGAVNDLDAELRLPRLAPWSFGIAGNFTHDLGQVGVFGADVSFNYRDEQFYDDVNLGILSAAEILDAGVSLTSANGKWKGSIYGRNLLNDVTEGTNTLVPIFSPTSTFTTLNRGRVIGAQLTYNY